MDDWLIVKLDCSSQLATKLGARLERRAFPRTDLFRIRDSAGQMWFWDIKPELLIFDDDLTPSGQCGA